MLGLSTEWWAVKLTVILRVERNKLVFNKNFCPDNMWGNKAEFHVLSIDENDSEAVNSQLGKNDKISSLKNIDDEVTECRDEIMKRVKQYYEELYSSHIAVPTINVYHWITIHYQKEE